GEERDQLAARELARHNDLALRIDRMNLKHPLRQIETNSRDSSQIPDRLAHGRLPFRWVDDNDHLGTLMPFGAPSTPSFRTGGVRARRFLLQDALRDVARYGDRSLRDAIDGDEGEGHFDVELR